MTTYDNFTDSYDAFLNSPAEDNFNACVLSIDSEDLARAGFFPVTPEQFERIIDQLRDYYLDSFTDVVKICAENVINSN